MNATKMIILLAGLGLGLVVYMLDQAAGGVADGAADPAADAQEVAVTDVPDGPVARVTEEELAEGFVPLIREWENGGFNKHGWNHYGPGWFTLDHETGILQTHGGMGLLWHSEPLGDFVLRLEFMTSVPESNSGIFLRVPEVPVSDDYIYHSFEIQIHDTAEEAIHQTGAVYDAEAPSALQHTGGVFDAEAPTDHREHPPGVWHDMEIAFVGDRITVALNGEQVTDWVAEPRGKIVDFAERGYIGLQNHDWDTSVYFRNIRVRKLD
ncbi:MAG: DUF1080 domain-containing protein [Gemmatimonadetes bacterium]|nr:DUF1080 domain-containing protein [Gemmatimonadota bacterium]